MKWRLKVAAFKVLSTVPGGRRIYRFSQQHITHSLDPSALRVSQKIGVGNRYLDWLAEHKQTERLLQGVHLDFGSGWHPAIPLFFYSCGVERQYLFDVVPVLDDGLLRKTAETFLALANDPNFAQRNWLKRRPPAFASGSMSEYLKGLGMSYHAPYADYFPALAGKVDVATSTQVLLHVPASAMPWCFSQLHQSLKPGGLFLATIHLRDILAGNFQTGLVKYHQLRYSPQFWERWINSDLMAFNRLKAPDYRDFLQKAGFEVLHFDVEPGSAEELKELGQVPIAECFKRYSREDLAARHLFFVARKSA